MAKVIKSADADFEEGDYIWGMTGWEDYSLILNTNGLFKIKYTDVPLSYYAGILGTNFDYTFPSYMPQLVRSPFI